MTSQSLIFVGKVITLFFHSTASLVMAECSCASLIFTSLNDAPSLACVDHKYLNWSTSSNTFPFINIGGWPWLNTVDGDFVLWEMISMPNLAGVFASLSC